MSFPGSHKIGPAHLPNAANTADPDQNRVCTRQRQQARL